VLMQGIWQAARAAWPEVDVPAEVFAAYVCTRIPEGVEPELALRQMRTSDLYLACACARGDRRAIAALDQHCLSVIDQRLQRMAGVDADIVDDVKQRLRCRLLLADAGPPGILEFSGRGELRGWLRVLAVREALAITRRSIRETPTESKLLERALLEAADPELEYFKRLYRSEFANAIAEAISRLSARQQMLLRQSIVDRLSVDQLGALYRVHRATAARWLAQAQRALSGETHAILTDKLRIQPAELRTIFGFIRSGLHVSLRLLFRSRKRKRKHALLREPPLT
jgi:RNA polymerase sigma-70 factor, ECF subfamily